MESLVPLVLNALTLISILMLVGIGLAVIFGLMNVINMAHGEFITIGAFTLSQVEQHGGSYWLGLAAAPFVGAAAGLVLERGIIRHLYARPLATILATWGISLVVQQSIQLIIGTGPQLAFGPVEGTVEILGALYPSYRLVLIAFAGIVLAASLAVFRYTQFGLDLRAVIQQRDMADALGIDTRRVSSIAFAVGAGLAAFAGVLIAPLSVVVASMGVNYLAKSFFVVIVGGTGGIAGVAAGSAVVGGLETVLNYQLTPTLSQALVLVAAIVLVRLRPRGLVPA